ncbi:hypothetical protein JI747_000295 [Chryseobacterium sp. RG1]|uniref:Uncharacterized protein n=1 Tax=Chryseobacterium tagetis TaxID=2801334 RepID=A0ABS7ZVH7_9FLAO|nr:hypothetical protein [Chryseobacterium tagetis]MCA6065592.1 hypothetical protein [Chryseobacterium tagetis]
MKKIILLAAFGVAGLVSAKDIDFKIGKEKAEAIAASNVVNENKAEDRETEDLEGTCTRCVRQIETSMDPSTGETSSTTIQYCYDVPC